MVTLLKLTVLLIGNDKPVELLPLKAMVPLFGKNVAPVATVRFRIILRVPAGAVNVPPLITKSRFGASDPLPGVKVPPA